MAISAKTQNSIRAAYYRGGAARAVMLRTQDLPSDKGRWPDIFRGILGSPDPWGRQLDGLGTGLSSLSKVCVVGPSTNPSADVDCTVAAIGVDDPSVDFSANCGNMSFAVGPFAIESGLTTPNSDKNGLTTVRIFNTNTGKIMHSVFPTQGQEAVVRGDFSIDGVNGTGAQISLRFIEPGGSKTGRLLPTGNTIDVFESIRTTCIDASNPSCFVLASELGIVGSSSPEKLDEMDDLRVKLEAIRRQAGVKMGLAKTEDEVSIGVPKISIVSQPSASSSEDLVVRAISMGQAHNGMPITIALATAVAANIPGTVVYESRAQKESSSSVLIAHPTGQLAVDADISNDGSVKSATVYSTARRLMEGTAYWK
ncbi:3-methylitaconate isomerase [Colletotrichum truncatum]|uniref:3-methylitaconate isomerase n=1 Tax=Colletotrichum truncatum TaxID=5467 RepID=A0ACC3YL29_COLTU|nr:3-methylitaconate isomerase [Colletotrichum truncatum]KAF6782603.1 3-methylitaconate isomerase [Colletotrichum truncatum]